MKVSINKIIYKIHILLIICAFLNIFLIKPESIFASKSGVSYENIKDNLIKKYSGVVPIEWGECVTGVKTKLKTKEKVIALTFDACGSKGLGKGYDEKLINFLIEEKIPATLFINSRWIDANPEIFKKLANNDLFEIENHGYQHKPLSVSGKQAYGIDGTKNISEVVDEVLIGENKIQEITGKRTNFFRSGTAYYDEVAVKVVKDLGYEAVNFSILGDAGATYTKDQVKNAYLKAFPGCIIISHMNHPEKETAEGVIEAVPLLKEMGYRFVKLEDYSLE